MVYMFNELSLLEVSSREAVCTVMKTFVNTHVKAKDAGLDDLKIHERSLPNLYSLNLSADYNIDSWLKDNRVSSDLRDNFLLISTTSPLVTASDIEQDEQYSRSEFFKTLDKKDHQVWGLGATYIYDTISFSLATHEEWDKTKVDIIHYYLDENAEAKNAARIVRHFSTEETLASHLLWYQTYQLENLKKGTEIWNKREELFPSLKFNSDTEKQFKGIRDARTLSKVCNAFSQLDIYVKNWKVGGFSYEHAMEKTGIKISPESASTNQQYGARRTFAVPGLGRKLFDLHIKLGDIRIHFYPEENTKIIYIGYIGRHLRIASEN
jgi:hypothetical protein